MPKQTLTKRIIDYRPMLFIAVFLALGILCGYFLERDPKTAYILGALALLFAFLDIIKNRRIIILLMFFFSFAAGLMLINLQMQTKPLPFEDTQVTGRITSATHYDTRSYYVLDDWSFVDGDAFVFPRKDLRLATEDNSLIPGDVVTFSGTLVLPDEKRNIGGFDERLYLLGKNIGYTTKGSVGKITVLSHRKDINNWLFTAGEYIKETIDTLYPKATAGIAKGLILGDKSDIQEADYDMFKRGGTASILAVSGLHFGILSLFVFWVLFSLGMARKPANFATAVFMLLYAGLVGFSVSATRALIMGLAVVFANLLGKQKDYLSFLSTAFVVSLILSPASLFSTGFMLSFGAVFALLALGPVLAKPFGQMPQWFSGLFTAPVAATIGTAPFIINFFYYFSVVGIVANIVVIPIGSLAVVTTFVAVMLGQVAGVPFAWLSDKLIGLMQLITAKLTALPFATVDMAVLPVAFVVLWFVLIFLVSQYCRLKAWFKRVLVLLVVAGMAAAIVVPPMLQQDALEIYFVDVGQGDAILITTPEKDHYLVDTGREYAIDELERVLKSQGIHLDGLFLTHADNDHTGGAQTLLDDGLVSQVYLPYAGRNTFDLETDTWITLLESGDTLNLSSTVQAKVLNPPADADDDNQNAISLCLLLSYQDKRIFLTGDINESVEYAIMKQVGDIDVLKVTHHGTKYGSVPAFLAAVDAEIAVITCGENYYGHPAPQTLYNLGEACDIIYRTDQDGGITMVFDDDIEVTPVIGPRGEE